MKLKPLISLFLDIVFADGSQKWDLLLTAMLPFCQAMMEKVLLACRAVSEQSYLCTLPPLIVVKQIASLDSLRIFIIFSHSTTSSKYQHLCLVWVGLYCIWHQLYQTWGGCVQQLHLDLRKVLDRFFWPADHIAYCSYKSFRCLVHDAQVHNCKIWYCGERSLPWDLLEREKLSQSIILILLSSKRVKVFLGPRV